MDFVKEAFLLEKKNQEDAGIICKATVDCYTDFIFINRFGYVQQQGTLNKATRRIIRDCNDEDIIYSAYPLFSSHDSIWLSEVESFPRNPSVTVLSGHNSRIFERPPLMPVEPLVQNGMIVLPDRS